MISVRIRLFASSFLLVELRLKRFLGVIAASSFFEKIITQVIDAKRIKMNLWNI